MDCDRFTIERFESSDTDDGMMGFEFPTNGLPHVFMGLEGVTTIEAGGNGSHLERGQTALLPAGAEQALVELAVRDNTPPRFSMRFPRIRWTG